MRLLNVSTYRPFLFGLLRSYYGLENSFQVRKYKPSDSEGIVELLENVFKGWPRLDLECSSLDHWRWKFDKKYLPHKSIVVAVKDEKIIGVLQSAHMRLKVMNEIVSSCLGADAGVIQEYRRRGVRNQISKLVYKIRAELGIKLIYTVTSNPITIRMLLKERHVFPFKVLNMTRIRDIDLQLEKMPMKRGTIVKMGFLLSKVINQIENSGKETGKVSKEITSVKTFSVETDKFWNRVKDSYDFIIVKDREYLNWRYTDPRAGRFEIRQATEGKQVLGYCILRINKFRKDYPVGYIMDLITLPEQTKVADLLIRDAVKYFDKNNVNIINCLLVEKHHYKKVLSKHGFINSRTKLHLFHNDIGLNSFVSEKINHLNNPDRIHFTYGDIDSLPTSLPKIY
jgi:hypothetical protein